MWLVLQDVKYLIISVNASLHFLKKADFSAYSWIFFSNKFTSVIVTFEVPSSPSIDAITSKVVVSSNLKIMSCEKYICLVGPASSWKDKSFIAEPDVFFK